MNILFVSTIFPNSNNTTVGIYSFHILTALRDLGYTIEVINPIANCPIIDPLLRKKTLPPTQEMLGEIPVTHPTFFYTPSCFIDKHYLFYRFSIGKLVKSGIARLKERSPNPDSPIHVMLGFIYPDVVAMAPVCQQLGLDYSIMIYGSDFRLRLKQPKFRPMVLKSLKEAPYIFCPGYRLKEDIVAEGIDGNKVHPFDNGIDTKVFQAAQSEKESDAQNESTSRSNSILFVGRLSEVKKIDRLLKAFKILIHEGNSSDEQLKDLSLDIVGDGALEKKLKMLAHDLNIEKQVNFIGRELATEIAVRMRKAKCSCLCSFSEGMPNTVLEALACGCPVVATDVGEVPLLIEEGINGYTVKTEGQSEELIVEDLAKALRKALSQEWDDQQIAQKMRRYTWPAAAKIISKAISN
jgi:glycosyltransferase involved in cell wall biosynthesis